MLGRGPRPGVERSETPGCQPSDSRAREACDSANGLLGSSGRAVARFRGLTLHQLIQGDPASLLQTVRQIQQRLRPTHRLLQLVFISRGGFATIEFHAALASEKLDRINAERGAHRNIDQ